MHSSVDGLLGFFHSLVIVNNAIINIKVHVSLQIGIFISKFTVPRNHVEGILVRMQIFGLQHRSRESEFQETVPRN